MTKRTLPAFCVALLFVFTGCDFVGDSDSVALPIAAIEVDDLPAARQNAEWDDDSAPDIVLEIQNAAGRALYRSEPINDVDVEAGPFRFDIPAVSTPSPALPLYVVVYETDGDYTTDLLMRTSESFRVADLSGADVVELGDVRGRDFSARLEIAGAVQE